MRGHDIELLPYDPNTAIRSRSPSAASTPNHNQLGPDDFVFGFTRVYAYDTADELTEVNPVITQVDTGNASHDGDAGLDVDGGDERSHSRCRCAYRPTAAAARSTRSGPWCRPRQPDGKQVWADFYSTAGTFTSSARLLYDPTAKLSIPSDTDNQLSRAERPRGRARAELHLDRRARQPGGADWVTVPLQIK